ncbi:MAG: phospholipid scramblase-related protein [Actinomycetota bacterium]
MQGAEVGSINAENWRAWNFSIKDQAGVEVARITKTWEGLATTQFTTADDYLLEVTGSPSPVLRTLILASAADVDLALKQDARGFG